jgi:hypothetical protein
MLRGCARAGWPPLLPPTHLAPSRAWHGIKRLDEPTIVKSLEGKHLPRFRGDHGGGVFRGRVPWAIRSAAGFVR